MRRMKLGMTAAAALLACSLTACGDAGDDDDGGPDVEAESDCDDKFEDGTRMAELADAGEIAIGVRFDQPGLGLKDATEDIPEGFDVDMAKLLIADLCIDPDSDAVTWTEAISEQREEFLTTGRVDLVAASYSITDERRALVGQTGPYLLTGQQVLVPADSDVESIEDLEGEEVCSASGSTSLENVEAAGAVRRARRHLQPVRRGRGQRHRSGDVDRRHDPARARRAVRGRGEGRRSRVLRGADRHRLLARRHPEMCEWINEVIQEAYDDGTWAEAFEANLGGEDVETPEPPALDACQS